MEDNDDDFDAWQHEDIDALQVEASDSKAFTEPQPVDNLILIIDARDNMLLPEQPRECHLSAALRLVVEVYRLKIQQHDDSRLAVLMIGTNAATRPGAANLGSRRLPKNVDVILPLDAPSADAILTLQNAAANASKFSESLGRSAGLPVASVLGSCMQILAEVAKATDHRRLFFITNDDDPGPSFLTDAKIKVSDCKDSGIEIIVLPIQHPTRAKFDPEKFWKYIQVMPLVAPKPVFSSREKFADRFNDDGGEVEDDFDDDDASSSSATSIGGAGTTSHHELSNVLPVSVVGTFDQLLSQTRRRLSKKRTYARVPLTLAPGVHLGVCLYNLLYPAKKPSAKIIQAETNMAVRSETHFIDQATGSNLQNHEIMNYIDVGKRRILFTKEESAAQRQVFGKGRGIEIIGFQARGSLRDIDVMRPPYFVLPSERDIAGSSLTFRALWQRMLDRNLVAIALLTTRNIAAPVVCALMPEQERRCDRTGAQLTPAGIYALPFPFADDIRSVQAKSSTGECSKDEFLAAEAAAKEVVTRLATFAGPLRAPPGGKEKMVAKSSGARIDMPTSIPAALAVSGSRSTPLYSTFEPSTMLPNPVLQQFYSGLEALALSLRDAPKVDQLLPPSSAQEAVIGEAAKRFVDATGLDESMTKPKKLRKVQKREEED